MPQSKHIGIVAVSAEGAALCYRTICAEGAAVLGAHTHPQVSMHTYPLNEYMRHVDADRWEEAGQLPLASASKLVDAGADILICPDNTLHQALDLVRGQFTGSVAPYCRGSRSPCRGSTVQTSRNPGDPLPDGGPSLSVEAFCQGHRL